jgi:hypothetical protein
VLDLDAADCLLNTPFSPEDATGLKEIFRNAGNCVRRVPAHYSFHAKRLLDTLGASLSAQKLERADQTVSVPGNAKRLLGLINVLKDLSSIQDAMQAKA